jgi:predicted small secreted protein
MTTQAALVALATLVLVSLLNTACGTAKGFGRDLQTVGRGIEKVAR